MAANFRLHGGPEEQFRARNVDLLRIASSTEKELPVAGNKNRRPLGEAVHSPRRQRKELQTERVQTGVKKKMFQQRLQEE